MAWYYEVRSGGVWTPRFSVNKPIVKKEMEPFHRNIKEITEEHEGKPLDSLMGIYGSSEFKSRRSE